MKLKLKYILFILVTVFSFCIVTKTEAASSAPANFNINASDIHMLYGSSMLGHGSSLNFTYKVNSDGSIVYCTQIHDAMPSSGSETYTLSGQMDAKFAYVLANGYPTKSITGNNEKDYYITGLAVWYLLSPNDSVFTHFNLSNGTYRGYSSEVVKEVAKLVNGANSYRYTEPSIKLNMSDDSLTLSSDGKYYVSSAITVKTTGTISNNGHKVSLENAPKGTIVTDSKGANRTTYGINEVFYVKVPVSSISSLTNEFKIKTSATGAINKAYLYKPAHSQYQSTAVLYPESKDVNNSTTLKVNLTTKVEIRKVDVTTREELPGATLTVKDANGKVVDTWVSTTEAHVIKGLQPGKYYLTETIAPEGYVLSDKTIEFEVKADGSVTKVEMENKLKDVIYIPISKEDATTGRELPGAHLELRDENNNLIEAWVSTDEPHLVSGLKPGKYYLSETLAPEGYELTKEVVEFVVKEDGTVDGKVVMLNKPETIIKVPSTSSFKTITASLIGIIVIGLGFAIVYRNYKKNEEEV